MAFVHGSNSAVTVNSNDLSAFTRDCEVNQTADTADVSVKSIDDRGALPELGMGLTRE